MTELPGQFRLAIATRKASDITITAANSAQFQGKEIYSGLKIVPPSLLQVPILECGL